MADELTNDDFLISDDNIFTNKNIVKRQNRKTFKARQAENVRRSISERTRNERKKAEGFTEEFDQMTEAIRAREAKADKRKLTVTYWGKNGSVINTTFKVITAEEMAENDRRKRTGLSSRSNSNNKARAERKKVPQQAPNS